MRNLNFKVGDRVKVISLDRHPIENRIDDENWIMEEEEYGVVKVVIGTEVTINEIFIDNGGVWFGFEELFFSHPAEKFEPTNKKQL
jgi:hypothetical protein